MQLFKLPLLRVSQVVEFRHAVEHALLLFWRNAIEISQAVSQLFLPFRRKFLKLRIAAQYFLLFFRRKIMVFPQPLTGRRTSATHTITERPYSWRWWLGAVRALSTTMENIASRIAAALRRRRAARILRQRVGCHQQRGRNRHAAQNVVIEEQCFQFSISLEIKSTTIF